MAAFKSPYQAADLGTVMRLMRRTLRFALLAAAVAVPLRSDDASILVQEEAKEDEAGLALLAFNEDMRAHDKQSERMFLEQNENSESLSEEQMVRAALNAHLLRRYAPGLDTNLGPPPPSPRLTASDKPPPYECCCMLSRAPSMLPTTRLFWSGCS